MRAARRHVSPFKVSHEPVASRHDQQARVVPGERADKRSGSTRVDKELVSIGVGKIKTVHIYNVSGPKVVRSIKMQSGLLTCTSGLLVTILSCVWP